MELPREVRKLIEKIVELWHADPQELVIKECSKENTIYDILTLLGVYSDEVNYEVLKEGNTIALRMFDILGNDWATIYYFEDGEPKCILLTPDP